MTLVVVPTDLLRDGERCGRLVAGLRSRSASRTPALIPDLPSYQRIGHQVDVLLPPSRVVTLLHVDEARIVKARVVADDGLPLVARAEIDYVGNVEHAAAHDLEDVESGSAGGSERAEDLKVGEEGDDEVED